MKVILNKQIIFFLLLTLFTANIFAANSPQSIDPRQRVDEIKNLPGKVQLNSTINPSQNIAPQTLGFDEVKSLSPGLQVGSSAFDMNSFYRMNRLVDWRGNQNVHFIWAGAEIDDIDGVVALYQAWNAIDGNFEFNDSPLGGCNTCPRHGWFSSEQFWLDIDTEGKAIIAANDYYYDYGNSMGLVVAYDFMPLSCFFSPYLKHVPDSLCCDGIPEEWYDPEDYSYYWPSIEYQVSGGDTVTHMVAYFDREGDGASVITYFRRFGSDTLGNWDWPPRIIDTVPTISQTVTAMSYGNKVALIWAASPGEYPGASESKTRDYLDPGLGHSRYFNDIYYMVSYNRGEQWEAKENITKYDSTLGGWLSNGDLSALIGTDENLHIVYCARKAVPNGTSLGEWENFFGGRIMHWDENSGLNRIIKDANWQPNDSTCTGGDMNNMFVAKPMLSECDGKLYTVYAQFNDYPHGLFNDCHISNFTMNNWEGTANGELYLSISNDGGISWDMGTNLTNTISPYCDHTIGNDCESDMWASVSRFGMTVTDGIFPEEAIYDPTGSYTGNDYLDIFYVNDKHPGSYMHNDAVWTLNPLKWLRVPCIDPQYGPCLPYIGGIGFPTWTNMGVQKDTVLRIQNPCSYDLIINSISNFEISGPSGWLDIDNYGPVTIGTNPDYYELGVQLNKNGVINFGPIVVEGGIILTYESFGTVVDTIPVELIVADTVQFPLYADIRTECKRMVFSNTGNIGRQGRNSDEYNQYVYGGSHLDFFDDCDTTDNYLGNDDFSKLYLYDASPFILRLSGSDTLFSTSIYNSDWGNETGFRPLEGISVDSTSYYDYNYANAGKFATHDSTLIMKQEYFAPKNYDSCDFIISKQTVYNNSAGELENIIIGNIYDWDIPSDSGNANGSEFLATTDMNLMFCYGAEYSSDLIENNDCVLADSRAGGLAFYGGYKFPIFNPNHDSLACPQAMWTAMNADWVYPSGNFVPSQLYKKTINTFGYEAWEATADQSNPDSMFQDLHMVEVYGIFDIKPIDTFVFVNIIVTEYDNGSDGLQNSVNEARQWIASRPEIFTWPEASGCCIMMGDVDGNGIINILDIVYLISYLYKNGSAPPCLAQADVNCSCTINIIDITSIIMFLYKDIWPSLPCDCQQWNETCDSILK
ncbi:MAG: dockerin type I domain-containing protein [Candidatus Zixiibacteriota bacterium]